MDHIRLAFEGMPIITLENGAKYLVNPLTDHVPATSFEFMEQVVREVRAQVDFSSCNKLVGEEERGGYLAAILAFVNHKPFSLVKWNPLGLVGEFECPFRSAYAEGKMYLNGIERGDKVIIVEDFVDTGGTLIALIKLIQRIGAIIIDVIAVVEKIDNQAHERIISETGVSPKWLARISIGSGRPEIVERYTAFEEKTNKSVF